MIKMMTMTTSRIKTPFIRSSCSLIMTMFILLVLNIVITNNVVNGLAGVPLSYEQRQRLIDKSNEFTTTYSSSWSNRIGKTITPVHVNDNNNKHNNVYVADRSFMWFGINVGGRCTIIELPSSDKSSNKPDLFIHSPVSLYDGDDCIIANNNNNNNSNNQNNNMIFKEKLESIGNIKYIMSPNYEHLKYANMWYDAYKNDDRYNIEMYGCPGLSEKIPSISWYSEIPYHYRPISWTAVKEKQQQQDNNNNNNNNKIDWDTSILQPLHLDMELNPFTGKPFFNEVLFYHVPTKTLLTTDFYWNYPNSNGITNSQLDYDGSWELAPSLSDTNAMPLSSSAWKFGMDQIYTPFYNKLMIKPNNSKKYNDIINHIMNVWDIETIIPCHGDIVRGKDNVQKAFHKAFGNVLNKQ